MPGFMDMLGPVGMGVSVAGDIYGAIKGAAERKKEQQQLEKQQEENKSLYDLNASQDFLDTNAAKSAMTEAKQNQVEERKNIAGRAAITGASDEAQVAGNTAATNRYNNVVSRLASAGTPYQLHREAMYRGTKNILDQQQRDIYRQNAENAASLVGNAGDLMKTAVYAEGMKKKKPSDNPDDYAPGDPMGDALRAGPTSEGR
jgi:hypothetical protein